MGLISTNLAPYDRGIIKSLSTEIVQTMRMASEYLDPDSYLSFNHPWNYLCWFWFGTLSPIFITKLKITLDRMATIINLHPVHIGNIRPSLSNKNRRATSKKPLSGWRNNTKNRKTGAIDAGAFITRSENEMFYILLDQKWYFTPKYTICTKRHHHNCGKTFIKGPFNSYRTPPCTGNHFSQFQAMIHELTHLLIHSQDHETQYQACLDLAEVTKHKAWKNADNWGYFLEEFRLHKLMAH
jgi:hypothetical protein